MTESSRSASGARPDRSAAVLPLRLTTDQVMRRVQLALLPVLIAQTLVFGPGVLLQVLLCLLSCLGWEMLCFAIGTPDPTHAHRRIPGFQLRATVVALAKRANSDGTVTLCGLLIALCLPPLAPWWVAVSAGFFAIVITRQVFGGTGNNLFNPAMAGYVAVLICYPAALSRWPEPDQWYALSSLWHCATSTVCINTDPTTDVLTGATALELMRFREGNTANEWIASLPLLTSTGGTGWRLINGAAIVGGLWLVATGIIRWQVPAAFIAGFSLVTLATADGTSTGHGPTLFHLFTGATMLGAFFIVTDPVTLPSRFRRRVVLAGLVGILACLIRHFGHYADGIAFAVLLGNCLVPLLNRLPAIRSRISQVSAKEPGHD